MKELPTHSIIKKWHQLSYQTVTLPLCSKLTPL